MQFNTLYVQYYKLIHFLLHKYHIDYNYDEYFQLLLIKLWSLSLKYDPSFNQCFKKYITYHLQFYLIDLLRQSSQQSTPLPLEVKQIELRTTTLNTTHLLLSDLTKALKPPEQQWFRYYLQGYRQKEIQQLMQRSPTTIRKYKTHALKHLKQVLTYDDIKKGF